MSARPTIVWFRQDLRLDDNPALIAAVARGGPVVPCYVHAPEEEDEWAPGGASKWWRHHSLRSLGRSLERKGARLTLRRGGSLESLRDLVEETQAEAVFWNRRYEPAAIKRDKAIKEALRGDGLEVKSFNSALLWEPWTVETQQGDPYKVFTPFWKRCLEEESPPEPCAAPSGLQDVASPPKSIKLDELELEPKIDWAGGIDRAWTPGEEGARKRFEAFVEEPINDYDEMRDRPDVDGTSRLSPHLHFGEISPRRVWPVDRRKTTMPYLREIAWREFAHHLLYHFPETPTDPLRPEFDAFPWTDDAAGLKRWQKGKTGFPIVDAGMRQLWETGWMHNRVRMIVASFLVKDLLLPWQEGARWFWDTLVDADLANNTLGWQWTAGCGADAAPYFRVFNPITQGEKFDPKGEYVRRWVPELRNRPDKELHQPAADAVVDHAAARKRALKAYDKLKGRA